MANARTAGREHYSGHWRGFARQTPAGSRAQPGRGARRVHEGPAGDRGRDRRRSAALNSVLPATNLDNVSLSDAIDFLRDVSGANIHVNWRALEGIGVGKDAQVNVKLRSVTLRKVLDLVVSEAGAGSALTYYVDQGVIEVTTHELADKDQFTRVYPIQDLIVEVPDFAGPDFNITNNNTGGGRGGGGGGGGGSSLFGGSSGGSGGSKD